MSNKEDIVEFYTGNGKDLYGRTFEDILKKSNIWLEFNHTYIQRLFPLKEESKEVKQAPVITEEQAEQLRSSKVALDRMKRAVDRMMEFYGFVVNRDNDKIKSIDDVAVVHHWRTIGNHNYKRITRILKSLKLMGLDTDAEMIFSAFSSAVMRMRLKVSNNTIQYWNDAIGNKIETKDNNEVKGYSTINRIKAVGKVLRILVVVYIIAIIVKVPDRYSVLAAMVAIIPIVVCLVLDLKAYDIEIKYLIKTATNDYKDKQNEKNQ